MMRLTATSEETGEEMKVLCSFYIVRQYSKAKPKGRCIGKIGLLEQAGIVTATMSWFVGILPCIAMSKK